MFCLCSKRTGCLYCYVLRQAGCGGCPGTLAPPLEGTVRQDADGIGSYQPPCSAPKTFVYYTPKCQHTRLPTKPSTKTPRVAVCGRHVLPDKACGWQAPQHPSLPKQLKQRNGPRTRTVSLPAALAERTPCFPPLRRCLGSSHANLQPSAPLTGVSIKRGPKTCFCSALNVFAIRSRCGELKEQFSGLNKLT